MEIIKPTITNKYFLESKLYVLTTYFKGKFHSRELIGACSLSEAQQKSDGIMFGTIDCTYAVELLK